MAEVKLEKLKSSRTNHIGKGGELGAFPIRLTVINWSFGIDVKIGECCCVYICETRNQNSLAVSRVESIEMRTYPLYSTNT